MEFKVLTFNIHHGAGTDRNLDLNRIRDSIQTANADIVGLNEVDKHFSDRSNFADQAMILAKELNMEYVYGPAITDVNPSGGYGRQFGNALLTRFPIIQSRNHTFDFLPQRIEDRALLEVKLRIDRREATAMVTHLSLAPFLHRKQTSFIRNMIEKTTGPVFIMGDWNMRPASKSWKHITDILKDVWTEKNPGNSGGYTFPSRRPVRRLDYIFVSKDIEAIATEVITVNRQASDHLPFMATLRLSDH